MRQTKNKVAKSKVPNNNESKNVSIRENSTTKKRIKQKSLGTIVAVKLKGTNTPNKNQSSVVQNKLKTKSQVSIKQKQSQHEISKEPTKEYKNDIETSDSLTNKANEASDVPVISFTKVTKENFGKTLLARKRNITDTNTKKTLSSIFSKRPESEVKETSLFDSSKKREPDENDISKKKAKEEFKEESKKPSDSPEKINLGKKKKKKQLEKSKTDNNSNVGDNKNINFSHKPVGKISSLFGHNPDIPNIGQRLVKPINEPIFTGTTFTDLKIHPFMVSIVEMAYLI